MHEDILRRLSDLEPGEPRILSVYLNLQPQDAGESPALRHGLVQLKERLSEIEKTLEARGPEAESFRADAARIDEFLSSELPSETSGLALFACSGRELFEVVEAGVPFTNQVSFAPAPDLFQLARLLDDYETAVVAVVDTNTARLFVTRYGAVQEVGGPDDKNTRAYRKGSMGGWSQSRYQRRIDNNRAGFAKESAAAIEQLVKAEGATRLILAGNEVAIPLLQEALSAEMAALAHDTVLRLDIRTPRDDVRAEVEPVLASIEAEEGRQVADRVIDAVQGGWLGVVGPKPTRKALERGQVDVLVLAAEAALDEETRAELVRLAAGTSAGVEVVEGHERLVEMGGVGGLLRYRT